MNRFLILVLMCLMLVPVYGCGGGGGANADFENTGERDVSNDPTLERALEMERQGIPLSGKEKAILEDAREAGIIE